ncbi:SCY1-like protein 2 [Trichonephila clavipes]|nr:SCY1-like protein 2 [Trichonephila clavipes]
MYRIDDITKIQISIATHERQVYTQGHPGRPQAFILVCCTTDVEPVSVIVTEALTFFHYSCKLIHRNLCPQSVIVNKRGTWKLAGLEFAERCNESDLMVNIR